MKDVHQWAIHGEVCVGPEQGCNAAAMRGAPSMPTKGGVCITRHGVCDNNLVDQSNESY